MVKGLVVRGLVVRGPVVRAPWLGAPWLETGRGCARPLTRPGAPWASFMWLGSAQDAGLRCKSVYSMYGEFGTGSMYWLDWVGQPV